MVIDVQSLPLWGSACAGLIAVLIGIVLRKRAGHTGLSKRLYEDFSDGFTTSFLLSIMFAAIFAAFRQQPLQILVSGHDLIVVGYACFRATIWLISRVLQR